MGMNENTLSPGPMPMQGHFSGKNAAKSYLTHYPTMACGYVVDWRHLKPRFRNARLLYIIVGLDANLSGLFKKTAPQQTWCRACPEDL
jgi:hypothetical protein